MKIRKGDVCRGIVNTVVATGVVFPWTCLTAVSALAVVNPVAKAVVVATGSLAGAMLTDAALEQADKTMEYVYERLNEPKNKEADWMET